MPLALTINQAVAALGCGRTKLYEVLGKGELPARKMGKRTLILASDLDAYVAGLPLLTKK